MLANTRTRDTVLCNFYNFLIIRTLTSVDFRLVHKWETLFMPLLQRARAQCRKRWGGSRGSVSRKKMADKRYFNSNTTVYLTSSQTTTLLKNKLLALDKLNKSCILSSFDWINHCPGFHTGFFFLGGENVDACNGRIRASMHSLGFCRFSGNCGHT